MNKLKKNAIIIVSNIVLSLILSIIFISTYNYNKHYQLVTENNKLKTEYNNLKTEVNDIEKSIKTLEYNDDEIYRTLLKTEPIPKNVRDVGIGGSEPINNNIDSLSYKLDYLKRKMVVQYESHKELYYLIRKYGDLLNSIPLIKPLKKTNIKTISSEFGYRVHPIYNKRTFHEGIDFVTDVGTNVYSTAFGTVETIKYRRTGYGNRIVINHGNGYKTVYAHLSKIYVKRGQQINRGDIIGESGNTGLTNGPHLHYEIVKDNIKVNPKAYFSYDGIFNEEYPFKN